MVVMIHAHVVQVRSSRSVMGSISFKRDKQESEKFNDDKIIFYVEAGFKPASTVLNYIFNN